MKTASSKEGLTENENLAGKVDSKEQNLPKRQIKKFIMFVIKVALVLVVTYYAYQGLFWYLWQYENGPVAYGTAYQHALYKQYKQISNPDRDNEIIFFGSSTCAFGIDVDAVKEVTGVNAQIFGIESAITPKFLIARLKEIAKPGDTICCVFDGGELNSESFINVCCAFEEDKDFLEFYFDDKYDFRTLKSSLVWRKLYALSIGDMVENVRSSLSEKNQVYKYSSFDENGNMNKERTECYISSDVSPSDTLSMDDVDRELIEYFNEFNTWCNENDIRFVIAYNMRVEGSLYNDENSLAEYHKAMEEAFDAEIVTKPEDGLLPYDCFYNSDFHLNSKGAREYSIRIAEGL